MEPSARYGILIILVGLFEVFATPAIMKRYMDRLQPKQYDMVIRMTRRSGLVVIVVGLTLMLGLWGRQS